MKSATILMIAALASPLAQADTREQNLDRLIKAQGIAEMFEQQRQYSKVEGEKQAREILNQFLSRMNPNAEFQKRFSDAFMSYIAKLESPWSTTEITAAWAKYYGAGFTDAELARLVTFYESPLGQKERVASQAALVQFTEHFRALGEPILKKATDEYIAELQLTAKECKCTRP